MAESFCSAPSLQTKPRGISPVRQSWICFEIAIIFAGLVFSEGVICEEEGGAAVKVNAASSFRGCSSAPAGLAAAAAGATC